MRASPAGLVSGTTFSGCRYSDWAAPWRIGFAIAAKLAASRPGCLVLLVAVETCTLAFRMDKLTKANIVATALFGDGAAACVIGAIGEGIAEVEMSGQHTWPDTLDIMGWSVDPEGLGVIFDRAIPPFAESHVNPAIRAILSRSGLSLTDIDRFGLSSGRRQGDRRVGIRALSGAGNTRS